MKPWKLAIRPHADVLSGTTTQSDFAADLSKVASGRGPREYADAEAFFARTFVTQGMRGLLAGVARRLAGQGGDPVLELQTSFGGGKTHTLLAVWHLATRSVPAARLAGVNDILDEAGVRDLPRARVAVFDGVAATAAQPLVAADGTELRTVWGRLAWQLLGREGYERVAECDRTGTAPGKEILDGLLADAGPCAILLDELVAFYRQLGGAEPLPAGSWNANLTFLQALTESVKAAPQAVLLATIPMSRAEAGDAFGYQVLDTLHKYFGRVGRSVSLVSGDEGCEIVKRRLFEPVEDEAAAAETCRAFAALYAKSPAADFPPEARESAYAERLRACYPIHPEVFDRLYGAWSSLPGFQRTRGVLKLLSLVMRALWEGDAQDALVLPAAIPVGDPDVSAALRGALGSPAWAAVVEKEVDGPAAAPAQLDRDEPVFGRLHAARGVARALFLATAPDAVVAAASAARGAERSRVLLGCAVPGETPNHWAGALGKLRDRLHYLFSDGDRSWFDTRPNLRREMESRKAQVAAPDVESLVRKALADAFGRSRAVLGFHPLVRAEDVPDDAGSGLRVVALGPDAAWTRADLRAAFDAARAVLATHGASVRRRRNRLVFLAPDLAATGRVDDEARTALAWRRVVDDIESGRLDVTGSEKAQAKRDRDASLRALARTVAGCWRVALVPRQEPPREPDFDVRKLPVQGGDIAPALEAALLQNEDLVENWAPGNLKAHLEKYYFRGGAAAGGADEVSAQRVWNDLCDLCEPDFRRLLSAETFAATVRAGLADKAGPFGYARGRDGDVLDGFAYRESVFDVALDERALLLRAEAAAARAAARTPPQEEARPEPAPRDRPAPGPNATGPNATGPGDRQSAASGGPAYRHFWAKADLDPFNPVSRVDMIARELLALFNARPGVKVKVSLDVEAESDAPFPADLVRAAKENAAPGNLGLSAEFS